MAPLMAPDMKTPAPKSGAGKGLRIALALSLALNLAVVGMVAGAMLRHGPDLHSGMVRELGFGPYTEALTHDDRKALRKALFDRAPEIRATRRQMREDTQALLSLLRADSFDADAFRARMESQHARMERQLRLGQDGLQDFIAAMSPDDRRAFADRLEAGLRRGGGKDRGDDRPEADQDAGQ